MHRQLARVWMDISSHSPICNQGALCETFCRSMALRGHHNVQVSHGFNTVGVLPRRTWCRLLRMGARMAADLCASVHDQIMESCYEISIQTLARGRAAHTVKWSQPWPCEGTTTRSHSDFTRYMKYMTPGTPVVRRVDARVRAWLPTMSAGAQSSRRAM